MDQNKRKRRRALLALLLLLLLSYAGYRAFATNPDVDKVNELRKELSAPDLTPEQRREKFQQLREAMDRLSTEDRRDISRAMSQERYKRSEADMQRYTRMSPRERTQYLDEQIKRMEEWRKQREQAGQGGASSSRSGSTAAPTGTSGTRPQPSAEERERLRKQRLDGTTPEYRAMRDQYMKDLQARRQQLGLPATTTRR